MWAQCDTWEDCNTKANQQVVRNSCGLDWSGMIQAGVSMMAKLMDISIFVARITVDHSSSLIRFSLVTNLKPHCLRDTSELRNCTQLGISMRVSKWSRSKWNRKINSYLRRRRKNILVRKFIKFNMILMHTWKPSTKIKKSSFSLLGLMKFGQKLIT